MDVIPSTSKGWLFLVGAVVVGAIIGVVIKAKTAAPSA